MLCTFHIGGLQDIINHKAPSLEGCSQAICVCLVIGEKTAQATNSKKLRQQATETRADEKYIATS